jgi:hypothetical protein
MGLFDDLFEKPTTKQKKSGTHSFLDDLSENEKERIQKEMDIYNLDDWERDEVINSGYDPMDFEDDDFEDEDDDYYNDEY